MTKSHAPLKTGTAKRRCLNLERSSGSVQRGVRERLATLTQDISGKFSRWKKGEIVKVRSVKGVRWVCIEKLKRKRSGILKEGLPILNELAGVPLRLLKFSNDQADVRQVAQRRAKTRRRKPMTFDCKSNLKITGAPAVVFQQLVRERQTSCTIKTAEKQKSATRC